MAIADVALPFLRDRGTAGEPDLSIDDDRASVSATVEPHQVPQSQRAEAADHHPSLLKLFPVALGHLDSPEAVEQQPDFDPGLGAIFEGINELAADFVRLKNVGLEVDGVASRVNRLQHGGEKCIAVLEHGDAATPEERAVQEHRGSFHEGVRPGFGIELRHVIVARPVGKEESPND
jgi:hypothetical protein